MCVCVCVCVCVCLQSGFSLRRAVRLCFPGAGWLTAGTRRRALESGGRAPSASPRALSGPACIPIRVGDDAHLLWLFGGLSPLSLKQPRALSILAAGGEASLPLTTGQETGGAGGRRTAGSVDAADLWLCAGPAPWPHPAPWSGSGPQPFSCSAIWGLRELQAGASRWRWGVAPAATVSPAGASSPSNVPWVRQSPLSRCACSGLLRGHLAMLRGSRFVTGRRHGAALWCRHHRHPFDRFGN